MKPLPEHLLHKDIQSIEADPFDDPELYQAVMEHNKQAIPAWWYRWNDSRQAAKNNAMEQTA